MEALHAELINLGMIVLTACVGLVTQQVMAYLKKKGLVHTLENNKEVTKLVVNGIEQMYTHLHGAEKLDLAKIELVKLMKARKVNINEKELDLLIESAVKEMNKTIKNELKKK